LFEKACGVSDGVEGAGEQRGKVSERSVALRGGIKTDLAIPLKLDSAVSVG